MFNIARYIHDMARTRAPHPTDVAVLLGEAFAAAARTASARALAVGVELTGETRSAAPEPPPVAVKAPVRAAKAPVKTAKKAPAPRRPTKRPAAKAVRK